MGVEEGAQGALGALVALGGRSCRRSCLSGIACPVMPETPLPKVTWESHSRSCALEAGMGLGVEEEGWGVQAARKDLAIV